MIGKQGCSAVAVFILVSLGGLSGTLPTFAQTWESWGTEAYRLEAGGSLQFQVDFERIPVRSWRLLIESDHILCDLNVLRLRDEILLYNKPHESHHDVQVPWGKGEAILVTLTARRSAGMFTVSFLGPPAATAPAAYSYEVNRALEAYARGERLKAENLCQSALKRDPTDGVARVMLAGFLKDRHYYDQATDLVGQALADQLPPDMRDLAVRLRAELQKLIAPLPLEIREGLVRIDEMLAADQDAEALQACDLMLASQDGLPLNARSRILRQRGRALHGLGRSFEAVDAFTQALTATGAKADQAILYYYMGHLFMDMDNLTQASGAFNVARRYGLPAGLDLRAVEALAEIGRRQP